MDASLVIQSRDTVNQIINNLNKSLSNFGRIDSNFMFVVERISLMQMTNFKNETSTASIESTNEITDKLEAENLKGYEIALILLGCIFGICFISLVVFLVLKFFKQNYESKSDDPLHRF